GLDLLLADREREDAATLLEEAAARSLADPARAARDDDSFPREAAHCGDNLLVSVFRPSVRLTSPDGREWEIYAYKLEVGERAEWDTAVVDADRGYQPAAAELAVVNAVVWLVMLVPRLVMRL